MPYNVIILTSTIMGLIFGMLYNLMVKRMVTVEEADKITLQSGLKYKLLKLKEKFLGKKRLKQTNNLASRYVYEVYVVYIIWKHSLFTISFYFLKGILIWILFIIIVILFVLINNSTPCPKLCASRKGNAT